MSQTMKMIKYQCLIQNYILSTTYVFHRRLTYGIFVLHTSHVCAFSSSNLLDVLNTMFTAGRLQFLAAVMKKISQSTGIVSNNVISGCQFWETNFTMGSGTKQSWQTMQCAMKINFWSTHRKINVPYSYMFWINSTCSDKFPACPAPNLLTLASGHICISFTHCTAILTLNMRGTKLSRFK